MASQPNQQVVAQQRPANQLEVLKSNLSKRADEFRMVLPSHITPEKFQRVIATAALQNPTLLTCDRQSLFMAAMKLAQDGLLPDGREAALVPFKQWNRETRETTWLVQPMPMVYGLRKKILQSGEVVSLETRVVYRAELESGNFLYEIGIDPPIRHRPKLDMTEEQATDDNIIAAYSIARVRPEGGGDPYWSVEVMSRVEINKVRQASQTGAVGRKTRDGKPIEPKGPWVDWFGEMARKTVMRRHSKVLPMSGDILDTLDRDIDEERAADSAAAYLSVEPSAPVIVPPTEEQERFDPETGESLNPPAGMTEVDEETARQLDRQAEAGNDDHPDQSSDAPAEPETSSTGKAKRAAAAENDQPPAGQPSEAAGDPGPADDVPPYAGMVRDWSERLDKADIIGTVISVDREFQKHREALPDDVVDNLEAQLNGAFERFGKPRAA